MMSKTLTRRLQAINAKDPKQLAQVRDEFSAETAPVDEAIKLASDSEDALSIGATWLLRAWLDKGAETTTAQSSTLSRLLPSIQNHHSIQHVCQCIGSLRIPRGQTTERFADFLRNGTQSERPFARAWATDGLVRLAQQHPSYLDDAQAAVAHALEDPKASVRARAKHLVDEV